MIAADGRVVPPIAGPNECCVCYRTCLPEDLQEMKFPQGFQSGKCCPDCCKSLTPPLLEDPQPPADPITEEEKEREYHCAACGESNPDPSEFRRLGNRWYCVCCIAETKEDLEREDEDNER